jgi:hypothetical protein
VSRMNASAAAGLRRIHASAAGLRRINASAAAAGSMNFSLLLPPGPLESLRDGLNQTVGLPAEGSALFNKVFYGIIAADVVIFVLLLACCAMETRDCEHCARCLLGGINAERAVVLEDEECRT